MAHSVLKNNAGFTLIEVMVAIVVLAIGILGAGSMQLSVLNSNAGSYDLTEATALALDQIENTMTWDYTDARLTDNNAIPNYQRIGTNAALQITTINSVADSSTVSGAYTIYLDSTDNPATDPTNPDTVSKTIRVDVVWREGSNLRTVSMSYDKLMY